MRRFRTVRCDRRLTVRRVAVDVMVAVLGLLGLGGLTLTRRKTDRAAA